MNRTIRMGVAGVGAFSLAVALPVSSALAQSGDPVITNTETVNVATDSSGDVESASVYDQIAIQGSGDVEYENPVSTAGLRNLDSFAGFAVEDGAIVEATTVDGQVRRRTISDFDLDLPVEIAVVYKLDGEEIDSGDLVGKTGELEVTYIVENMTGEPQEISFTDGEGNDITETQTVYEPMAGSLTFTLPSNFTDVQSESGAVIAGDGRGGTKMTFSVTLIPPLGSPVAEVSYTAGVTDATIPPANLSMIPVVISNNPTASGALESFQGGAETGAELAAGAAVIDENLLALADGAGTLLSGLILLRDGSAELSEGLVNTAAPGSAELAAGADELAAGLNGTAVPGSQQLSGGAALVADGTSKLDAGLAQLAVAVDGLPKAIQDQLATNKEYQALLAALQGIIDGIGTKPAAPVANPQTLGEAIRSLEAGLSNPACDPSDPTNPANPCGVKEVVTLVDGGVSLVASELGDASATGGDIDQLIQASIGSYQQAVSVKAPTTGSACPQNPAVPVPPVPPPSALTTAGFAADDICVLISNVVYGLGLPAGVLAPDDPGGLKAQTDAASAGLTQASGALGSVVAAVGDDTTDGTLLNGLAKVWIALSNPACDPANPRDPANPCGIREVTGLVAAGVPQVVDQVVLGIQAQLEAALGSPTAGCDPAASLRCASAALASGSDEVSDGAAELASGLVGAADGSNQVADGADQLADGLGDAADGSVQVASGLEDAAEAAPALPEGAQRLSEEGSSELIKAGNDTAVTFGQQVAVLEAGAERTADGGLPYGAPEDALRFAAYSYDIAGAAGTTSQNTGRLLWALVIGGGAAAGAAVLAQRRAA